MFEEKERKKNENEDRFCHPAIICLHEVNKRRVNFKNQSLNARAFFPRLSETASEKKKRASWYDKQSSCLFDDEI